MTDQPYQEVPAMHLADEAAWYGGGFFVRKGDTVLSPGAPSGVTENLGWAAIRAVLADLAPDRPRPTVTG